MAEGLIRDKPGNGPGDVHACLPLPSLLVNHEPQLEHVRVDPELTGDAFQLLVRRQVVAKAEPAFGGFKTASGGRRERGHNFCLQKADTSESDTNLLTSGSFEARLPDRLGTLVPWSRIRARNLAAADAPVRLMGQMDEWLGVPGRELRRTLRSASQLLCQRGDHCPVSVAHIPLRALEVVGAGRLRERVAPVYRPILGFPALLAPSAARDAAGNAEVESGPVATSLALARDSRVGRLRNHHSTFHAAIKLAKMLRSARLLPQRSRVMFVPWSKWRKRVPTMFLVTISLPASIIAPIPSPISLHNSAPTQRT